MTHLKSILIPLVALVAGISALSAVAVPPSGLVTCSNLTLELNGAPVWVEILTKACPPDAPDWFRYNTSNNLAVNIATFTCTNASTLNLRFQRLVRSLTVRPKNLRIAVTFGDIRVQEIITRMFELNVTDGQFYSQAPPGRIQGVRLKNITWEKACPILITGHSPEHLVDDVVFEGCRAAGAPLSTAQIQTNAFARRIVVR